MYYRRRRVCRVCERKQELNYKKPEELKQYMNRLGKILPRRATRLCAKHQRQLAREVNRARMLALLPYVGVASAVPKKKRTTRRR